MTIILNIQIRVKYRNKILSIGILFFIAILFCIKGIGQSFGIRKTSTGIELLDSSKKVLFYQIKPVSLNGKYQKCGYIHPLYGLNGEILTEDFPEDHPYHHGIFWAWHQIILRNKNIADAWVDENIFWQPVQLKIKKKKECIILQSELLWKSVLNNADTTPIIKENTSITVHQATPLFRAIDFDIQLFALVDSLKIGGSDDVKGYGGFCLRLKLPHDISFVSNGTVVTPMETAVTAGSWMDFVGSFGGDSLQKSGVAVFNNPANPGFQHQWILRREKSMQNIPFPGRTPVFLSKRGLRLKYRILIHNAAINNDEIEKLYQDYLSNRKS